MSVFIIKLLVSCRGYRLIGAYGHDIFQSEPKYINFSYYSSFDEKKTNKLINESHETQWQHSIVLLPQQKHSTSTLGRTSRREYVNI